MWKEDYYSQQGNFPFLNYLTTSHNKFNWAKYKLSRKDWVEPGKFLKWFNNSVRDGASNLIPVLLDNGVLGWSGFIGENYWDFVNISLLSLFDVIIISYICWYAECWVDKRWSLHLVELSSSQIWRRWISQSRSF